MLNVFQTDDGMFHQAVLSLNKLMQIRVVVEKLALKSEPAAEWEWTVWRTAGLWDGELRPVSGRETSLNAAKRQAVTVGVLMLAELTDDRAEGLPAPLAMRVQEHWHPDVAIEQH